VNARVETRLAAIAVLTMAALCHAESARLSLREGNRLYARQDWAGAISQYEKAASEDPAAIVPKFNKANALYRSGDFAGAVNGFNAVAGESRELPLVAKAKYNLGNCAFREGMRQKDSDLQKAIDSIKKAQVSWRETLAIDPSNRKAKENINKAALELKRLLDEQKKKEQEQKKDPNSQQQKQQDKQQQQQDPNAPGQQGQDKKEEQQKKEEQAKQDQKKQEEQKKEQEKKEEADAQPKEKKDAPDATAEQILNDEQDRKKQLRPNQPGGYQPVDQDW